MLKLGIPGKLEVCQFTGGRWGCVNPTLKWTGAGLKKGNVHNDGPQAAAAWVSRTFTGSSSFSLPLSWKSFPQCSGLSFHLLGLWFSHFSKHQNQKTVLRSGIWPPIPKILSGSLQKFCWLWPKQWFKLEYITIFWGACYSTIVGSTLEFEERWTTWAQSLKPLRADLAIRIVSWHHISPRSWWSCPTVSEDCMGWAWTAQCPHRAGSPKICPQA